MPLQSATPPPQADSVLRETIQGMAGQGLLRTPALRGTAPGDLELSDPHEVFTLGLDDLRADPSLAAAQPAGWRYLVRRGDGVVAAAHSAPTGNNGDHMLSQVNEGPFVAATVEALSAAGSEPGSYTPRLLQIPALHAVALWLHGTGDDDQLVPLAPFPLDVPTGAPMPAAELLRRLAESAPPPEIDGDDDMKGS